MRLKDPIIDYWRWRKLLTKSRWTKGSVTAGLIIQCVFWQYYWTIGIIIIIVVMTSYYYYNLIELWRNWLPIASNARFNWPIVFIVWPWLITRNGGIIIESEEYCAIRTWLKLTLCWRRWPTNLTATEPGMWLVIVLLIVNGYSLVGAWLGPLTLWFILPPLLKRNCDHWKMGKAQWWRSYPRGRTPASYEASIVA